MTAEHLPSPEQMTEREDGCWSDNVAVGYAAALNRCKGHLREAAELLERDQVPGAQKAMAAAQGCMNEANVWFNQANNQSLRVTALVREVKALRSGLGVTYAIGSDPVDDNWRQAL